MDIIKQLEWRYAAKAFDAEKKISDSDFDELLESVRLSPSSYGLQLWKAFVVKNSEKRKELSAAAYNQTQVTDASHFIVFAIPKVINDKSVDEYIKLISEVRSAPVESLEGFSKMMKGAIDAKKPEELKEWAGKQTYIALGFLLETAALKNIDSCPMEGFNHAKFDEILGLSKKGYESTVACAIGYRSEKDDFAKHKKVRFPKNKIFDEI